MTYFFPFIILFKQLKILNFKIVFGIDTDAASSIVAAAGDCFYGNIKVISTTADNTEIQEVARATAVADEIAKEAEFFSFGTNDLTQTVFAYSRDDSGKFINTYMDTKVELSGKTVEILERDPFTSIDIDGVGEFMKLGLERGKSTRKNLKVGICGEHGGDPNSIDFCHKIGLDYVSCSPFRVPIARLAAARIALKD